MVEYQPSRAVNAGVVVTTLLLALVIGFGLFRLVSIGRTLAGDASLETEVFLAPDEVSLPAGMSFHGWPEVTLELDDPTTAQTLLDAATGIGPFLLVVATLWLLRGLAGSVRRGDPFGMRNVRRLRALGFLLVLGALAVAFANSILHEQLYSRLPAGRFGDIGSGGLDLSTGPLLAGLGAFILAEVFAHGLRLREDVEATV